MPSSIRSSLVRRYARMTRIAHALGDYLLEHAQAHRPDCEAAAPNARPDDEDCTCGLALAVQIARTLGRGDAAIAGRLARRARKVQLNRTAHHETSVAPARPR